MTTKTEVLKMALEMVQNKMYAHAEMYLKEALAEPEQEPIGYLGLDDVENLVEYPHRCRNLNIWSEGGEGFAPIYTTPPQRKPLDPVDGDLLPAVGSQVLIHLASQDEWVERTVVGYYVWGAFDSDRLHRVYVRVKDSDGILNARMLGDVRPIEAAHGIKE